MANEIDLKRHARNERFALLIRRTEISRLLGCVLGLRITSSVVANSILVGYDRFPFK